MSTLYLKRTLTGFVAADEAAGEDARKFKVGEIYRAEIVKPRSYQHHKLAFSLLMLTYKNLPHKYEKQWPTFQSFRKAIARAAGHIVEYTSVDGEVCQEADSLSYDRLDEVEFGKVFAAMMTVCAHLLEMEDEHELAAEVSRYADQNYGRAA